LSVSLFFGPSFWCVGMCLMFTNHMGPDRDVVP
jgi:hypothetical protein